MTQIICCEIFHMYLDDPYPSMSRINTHIDSCIDILQLHKNSDYVIDFQILIDNVHWDCSKPFDKNIIDMLINDFYNALIQKIGCVFCVSVIYESSLYNTDYINLLKEIGNPSFESFKVRGVVKQVGMYINNEFYAFFSVDFEGNLVPTCLCYSFCLAFQRLTIFENVFVIIEKTFQPVENKVKNILELLINNNSNVSISNSIIEWKFI